MAHALGGRMVTKVAGEEERCDKLVTQLGGTLYRFSLPNASPFKDVPDRRYYLRGHALWAEIKRPSTENVRKDGYARTDKGDQLTRGQLDFLKAEYLAGEIVFAGGRDALEVMLLSAPNRWRALGWEWVAIVAVRGLRAER